MGDADLIMASLERAAERTEDLTPQVFDHFLALHPEAAALFPQPEDGAKGRMLNEILSLVLDRAAGKAYVESTVTTSAADHSSWGVNLPMYRGIFASLLAVLQDLLGEAWDAQTREAWRHQVDAILDSTGEAYRRAAAVATRPHSGG